MGVSSAPRRCPETFPDSTALLPHTPSFHRSADPPPVLTVAWTGRCEPAALPPLHGAGPDPAGPHPCSWLLLGPPFLAGPLTPPPPSVTCHGPRVGLQWFLSLPFSSMTSATLWFDRSFLILLLWLAVSRHCLPRMHTPAGEFHADVTTTLLSRHSESFSGLSLSGQESTFRF